MCAAPLSDLLKRDPNIDELFSFHKVSVFGRRNTQRDIIEKLRRGKHDVGILLPNSFSSAWWFWQGNVSRRIGFRGELRSFLLTDPVPLPKNREAQHLVVTYKQLLAPLNIPLSNTRPCLHLSEQEITETRDLLKEMGADPATPLIGINPGAAYGTAKCWLPERFREVTEKLLEQTNATLLFFGNSSGASLVRDICQGFPARVINLAGQTSLRELASLIKLCNVLLTNDSGPMHIASAVGTPLVALFGSTNEKATGPYQTGTIIHKHTSCSPCYQRICPIDFRCMKQITVEEVLKATLNTLHSHA
jgi:heptosyltransferase-2